MSRLITQEELREIEQGYQAHIEALQERYQIALSMLTPEQQTSIQTTIEEKRHMERMMRKKKQ